jgi:hypothetical protein
MAFPIIAILEQLLHHAEFGNQTVYCIAREITGDIQCVLNIAFTLMLTLHWPDMSMDCRCLAYRFGWRNFNHAPNALSDGCLNLGFAEEPRLINSSSLSNKWTEESIDARQAPVYLLTTMKMTSFDERGCVYCLVNMSLIENMLIPVAKALPHERSLDPESSLLLQEKVIAMIYQTLSMLPTVIR